MKLTEKQKKIAEAAAPVDQITGDDFKELKKKTKEKIYLKFLRKGLINATRKEARAVRKYQIKAPKNCVRIW